MKIKFIGILMLTLVVNCHAQQNNDLSKKEKTSIIDNAIRLLRENYVFPNRVENIEKHVREKLAKGGYDSLNHEVFFGINKQRP